MSAPKFAVIVFPASNCDVDCYDVLTRIFQLKVEYIWHKDTPSLKSFDAVILPGGFSYGDYLRAGAMARHSPIMQEVIKFAKQGKLVMGICNGFQILVESGLLPGAMLMNQSLDFVCESVAVIVNNNQTAFTRACHEGEVLKLPIAHKEGNYYAEEAVLDNLEQKGQAPLVYLPPSPNGSSRNIAGVMNEAGNVFGMMPHPERASEEILGSKDGMRIFQSMLETIEQEKA